MVKFIRGTLAFSSVFGPGCVSPYLYMAGMHGAALGCLIISICGVLIAATFPAGRA